jgi:hypothetical protein
MKKSKITTIVILIAVVGIAAYLYFQGRNIKTVSQINVTNNTQNLENKVPEILGNKADLISCSVSAGQSVSGELKFSGIVKGGYFFEGNIVINILDQNKNVLKTSHANAITEWMTVDPVSFMGSIDLTGLQTGPAYFEIHNDNASGLPENDKSILIPITIQ